MNEVVVRGPRGRNWGDEQKRGKKGNERKKYGVFKGKVDFLFLHSRKERKKKEKRGREGRSRPTLNCQQPKETGPCNFFSYYYYYCSIHIKTSILASARDLYFYFLLFFSLSFFFFFLDGRHDPRSDFLASARLAEKEQKNSQ